MRAEEEVIVRIRFWENQEEHRDVYYTVPEGRLGEIQKFTQQGSHAAARDLVEACGRPIEPKFTVEIDEF